MPNPASRKVLLAVGLCALLVLLFSCAAAVRDDGGGCWDMGLTAATKATHTARPAPLLSKTPAPPRTATPARTSPTRAHGHGHGGVDIDLDACP
ncbi:hypothetical protein ACWEFD_17755 [Streptomyces ardesiacus]